MVTDDLRCVQSDLARAVCGHDGVIHQTSQTPPSLAPTAPPSASSTFSSGRRRTAYPPIPATQRIACPTLDPGSCTMTNANATQLSEEHHHFHDYLACPDTTDAERRIRSILLSKVTGYVPVTRSTGVLAHDAMLTAMRRHTRTRGSRAGGPRAHLGSHDVSRNDHARHATQAARSVAS